MDTVNTFLLIADNSGLEYLGVSIYAALWNFTSRRANLDLSIFILSNSIRGHPYISWRQIWMFTPPPADTFLVKPPAYADILTPPPIFYK